MTKRTESRARRTVLATVVATATLWGSFGAAVHADEEPVDDATVETGQTDDGATVAVGAPPVPPTPPVVAVGEPPVPPVNPPVVAVGEPPVPAAPPVAAPPVAAPPVDAPAAPAKAAEKAVTAARPHGLRQAASFSDQLADLWVDVIATIEAALALINGQL